MSSAHATPWKPVRDLDLWVWQSLFCRPAMPLLNSPRYGGGGNGRRVRRIRKGLWLSDDGLRLRNGRLQLRNGRLHGYGMGSYGMGGYGMGGYGMGYGVGGWLWNGRLRNGRLRNEVRYGYGYPGFYGGGYMPPMYGIGLTPPAAQSYMIETQLFGRRSGTVG